MALHILWLYLTSLFATVFVLPISSLDAYLVGAFNLHSIYITLPVIIAFEVLNAWLVYKLSSELAPIVIRREKHRDKIKELGVKVGKYGFWIILVSAMTPLPYSLTIYASGIVGWKEDKQFILAILIGRTVKYVVLAIAVYYGWQLVEYI